MIGHLAGEARTSEHPLVEEWRRSDATLILEVLARLDEHVLEVGRHVVRIRSLLEDEDGEEEEEEDNPQP